MRNFMGPMATEQYITNTAIEVDTSSWPTVDVSHTRWETDRQTDRKTDRHEQYIELLRN